GPFNDAGGDAVDGDVGGEGAGEAAGEGGEGAFAGAICEIFGPGAIGEEVDHVDDVAAGLAEEIFEAAGEEEGGMEVDGEEVVDLFVGGILEGGGLIKGGVVDEGIEAAEIFGEGGEDSFGGELGIGE